MSTVLSICFIIFFLGFTYIGLMAAYWGVKFAFYRLSGIGRRRKDPRK